jgi:hypothetical protein
MLPWLPDGQPARSFTVPVPEFVDQLIQLAIGRDRETGHAKIDVAELPHAFVSIAARHRLILPMVASSGRRGSRERWVRFHFRSAHLLRALARGFFPSARGLVPVARLPVMAGSF